MVALAVSWLNAASISAIASAAATILLALFTWRLAVQTRKLAGQTEQDVSAQWRPVLIYGKTSNFVVNVGQPLGILRLRLYNAGSGAALNASIYVDFGGAEKTGPVKIGTIAESDGGEFSIPDVAYRMGADWRREWIVVAEYEDLARTIYQTRLTVADAARNVKTGVEAGSAVDVSIGLTHTSIDRESDTNSSAVAEPAKSSVLAQFTGRALHRVAQLCEQIAVALTR